MPLNGDPARLTASCRGTPHWHEFGHWLAILIGIVGLNEQTWNYCRRKLGLSKPCGCPERIDSMNALGRWLQSVGRELAGYWYNSP